MHGRSDKEKLQILNLRLRLGEVSEIFGSAESEKFQFILIKGLAAAINYPKTFQRSFSDIDLAVNPKYFEEAKVFVRENNLNVDLHSGLRHLDTSGWEDLYRNSGLISIDGINLRILRAEDHLRVLCVHWLNDGGADRTRLWDIFFALKYKPPDFDWDRFFNSVGEKRKVWLLCVVGLVVQYLGLQPEDLPDEFSKTDIPLWVKRQVEREWKSDYRLLPIENSMADWREFIRQIRKRIPPNALQATIELEGRMDDSSVGRNRFFNIFTRSKTSLGRFFKSFGDR